MTLLSTMVQMVQKPKRRIIQEYFFRGKDYRFVKLVETSKIFFKIQGMMSSSNGKSGQIDGLSKRELSKLERLMEAEKAQKHSKSYKRKPPKGKHPEEPNPRKLIKTESASNNERSNEESSSNINEPKSKLASVPPSQEAKPKKERKHLNSNFPLEGSDQNVIDYLLMYSFTEKGKKMEQEEDDMDFLENISGITLVNLEKPDHWEAQKKVLKKFNEVKDKIDLPFDEEHLDFNKKFCTPQYLNS